MKTPLGGIGVRLSPDRAAQAREMAGFVAERLREAIAARGRAVLAVSGGRSPVPFFERLRDQALDWSAVTLLLVDERVVPARHPDSNAALVQRHLRQGAAAAAHWVPLLDPDWGDAYPPSDRQGVAPVAKVAGASPSPMARGDSGAGACADLAGEGQAPADLSDESLMALAQAADARVAAYAADLDVVVLGMGEDGHTASLFPDDPRRHAWQLSPRLVEWARPRSAPHARLTLTLPRLQAARTLVLGLQGEGKRVVFEQACRQPTTDLPLSLLLVPPAAPMQVWLAP